MEVCAVVCQVCNGMLDLLHGIFSHRTGCLPMACAGKPVQCDYSVLPSAECLVQWVGRPSGDYAVIASFEMG